MGFNSGFKGLNIIQALSYFQQSQVAIPSYVQSGQNLGDKHLSQALGLILFLRVEGYIVSIWDYLFLRFAVLAQNLTVSVTGFDLLMLIFKANEGSDVWQ